MVVTADFKLAINGDVICLEPFLIQGDEPAVRWNVSVRRKGEMQEGYCPGELEKALLLMGALARGTDPKSVLFAPGS